MTILARLLDTVNEMTTKLDMLRGMELGWVEELAVLHALQVHAQAVIDIIMHIASELGYAPESPGEALRFLEAENLVTREEAELVKRLIGFRNILVHQYAQVDMRIVGEILQSRKYQQLTVIVARIVERALERGVDP